jgi:hypothetical protein
MVDTASIDGETTGSRLMKTSIDAQMPLLMVTSAPSLVRGQIQVNGDDAYGSREALASCGLVERNTPGMPTNR